MAVRVLEVGAAAAEPVVDPTGVAVERVGPVGDPAVLDPAEDLVELLVADQEGVVPGGDRPVDPHDVHRDVVGEPDDEEGLAAHGSGQTEDLGQEARGLLVVPCRDDRVVQLNGHGTLPSWDFRTYRRA